MDSATHDSSQLSCIGKAAFDVLAENHSEQRGALWNLSRGSVVGSLQQTPRHAFCPTSLTKERPSSNEDWFVESLTDVIKRTEFFCDILNMSVPDGDFLHGFREAMEYLDSKKKPIVVRMMFANFVCWPINAKSLVRKLSRNLSPDTQLSLWVGAWRSTFSWNHAKIIAVDGQYLHTGGHNLWHRHYLNHSPVFDLSVELKGSIALDGHAFANEQWALHQKYHEEGFQPINIDWGTNIWLNYTTLACFPPSRNDSFPPFWQNDVTATAVSASPCESYEEAEAPMISMGCYVGWNGRACSDDAFIAMFSAARQSVKMVIQDFGPMRNPGMNVYMPGCDWPVDYFRALGEAIWKRGVTLEVVFSNLNSVPGGLTSLEADYSNRWTCEDSAARLLLEIRNHCLMDDSLTDEELCSMLLGERIKFCYLRTKNGNRWEDGSYLALHSKFFVVDDQTAYIGSQNLYKSKLAEWGVVIDDGEQTRTFMEEYWDPMFAFSYQRDDCNLELVLPLMVDPDRNNRSFVAKERKHFLFEYINVIHWRANWFLRFRLLGAFLLLMVLFAKGGICMWLQDPVHFVFFREHFQCLLLFLLLVLVVLAKELLLQKRLTSPPLVLHGQVKQTRVKKLGKIYQRLVSQGLFEDIVPSLFFGTNSLIATLAGFVIKGPKPCSKFVYFRELLTMHDKATIALDWELPAMIDNDNAIIVEQRKNQVLEIPISHPVVLILHGIGNNTKSGYMRSLMRSCVEQGWMAVGMNYRGCAGLSTVTSPSGYTGAYTGDLRSVVETISSRMNPGVPLLLVGHSIGANLVVKYLGEEGFAGTLPAAVVGGVSLANPCDIRSDQWRFPMTQALNVVAKKTLLQTTIKFLPTMMRNSSYRTALRKALFSTTLQQFDSAMASILLRNHALPPFSPRVGYRCAEDYWDDAGSYKYARNVTIPVLHVTSQDDFLVYQTSKERTSFFQENPNILAVETKTGGHLGWYESRSGSHSLAPTSWAGRATITFIDAVLKSSRETV